MIPVGNPLSPALATLAEGPGASKDGQQEQRRAWQREMERAQLAAWLSHGVVGKGTSAPAPSAHLLAAAPGTGGAAVGYTGFVGWRAVGPVPTAAAVSADIASQGAPASVAAQTNAPGSSRPAQENSRQPAPPAKDTPFPELRLPPVQMAAMTPAVSTRPLAAMEAQTAALGLEFQLDPFASLPFHSGATEGTARTDRQAQIAPAHRFARSEASGGARRPIRIHAEWTAEGVHVWLALDAGVLAHQEAIVQQVRRWVAAQGGRVLSLSCNARPLPGSDECEPSSAESSVDTNIEVKEKAWPSVR